MQENISTNVMSGVKTDPGYDKFAWSNPLERGTVKARILAVSPTARNRKERETLVLIEKEEKREDRSSALRYKLMEAADKWGRKAVSTVVRLVTEEVAKFSDKEKKMIDEANTAYKKSSEAVKEVARKKMAIIQNELTAELNRLEKDRDESISAIRTKAKPKYAEAEARMNSLQKTILERVGSFGTEISVLSVEQLDQLSSGEPVVVSKEGVESTITVPGTHKKERALVGEE